MRNLSPDDEVLEIKSPLQRQRLLLLQWQTLHNCYLLDSLLYLSLLPRLEALTQEKHLTSTVLVRECAVIVHCFLQAHFPELSQELLSPSAWRAEQTHAGTCWRVPRSIQRRYPLRVGLRAPANAHECVKLIRQRLSTIVKQLLTPGYYHGNSELKNEFDAVANRILHAIKTPSVPVLPYEKEIIKAMRMECVSDMATVFEELIAYCELLEAMTNQVSLQPHVLGDVRALPLGLYSNFVAQYVPQSGFSLRLHQGLSVMQMAILFSIFFLLRLRDIDEKIQRWKTFLNKIKSNLANGELIDRVAILYPPVAIDWFGGQVINRNLQALLAVAMKKNIPNVVLLQIFSGVKGDLVNHMACLLVDPSARRIVFLDHPVLGEYKALFPTQSEILFEQFCQVPSIPQPAIFSILQLIIKQVDARWGLALYLPAMEISKDDSSFYLLSSMLNWCMKTPKNVAELDLELAVENISGLLNTLRDYGYRTEPLIYTSKLRLHNSGKSRSDQGVQHLVELMQSKDGAGDVSLVMNRMRLQDNLDQFERLSFAHQHQLMCFIVKASLAMDVFDRKQEVIARSWLTESYDSIEMLSVVCISLVSIAKDPFYIRFQSFFTLRYWMREDENSITEFVFPLVELAEFRELTSRRAYQEVDACAKEISYLCQTISRAVHRVALPGFFRKKSEPLAATLIEKITKSFDEHNRLVGDLTELKKAVGRACSIADMSSRWLSSKKEILQRLYILLVRYNSLILRPDLANITLEEPLDKAAKFSLSR